ncbi:hypothetical protein PRIPAC_87192 [Pristionchus pacificus]|uniref:Membrane transporter n=1 Tax=Pristionchus pacificus TaxID=54126 RepID=A0A2A6CZ77_PRIPA|nr:hypothetical protein PRIPAC_87192 [Pristionchus pacificus]|eukprot:PDM83406.1 membrane transporter [Pristionchus pacificus]
MGTQRDEEKRYNALFGSRVRFFVMLVVLFCLTAIWSNILTLNFVVICMAPIGNGTIEQNADRYSYSNSEFQWLISVVAIAALATNGVVVYLIDKIGIRTVFTGLGFLSAIVTMCIPMAIRQGYYFLLAARFLQGVSFAANFPVIGAFCAKWAYFKQVGLLVSVLVAYVQLSPTITMSVSGPLCQSSFGWPSVFYSHAVATFLIFVFYAIFYRNSPQKHPFVGSVEKAKIAIGKATVADKKSRIPVPYLAILRTPAVYAVWIASIANFGAVNLMLAFTPIYFSRVLGISITSTGFSAALPPLSQFVVKVVAGWISDRVKFCSETNKLRLFNSIAMIPCGGFFVVLGFLGTDHPKLNMLAMGAAAGFLGAATGGFFKAGPMISKQYSHVVTGAFSLMLTLMMLLIPIIVNAVLDGEMGIERWQRVFLGTAALMWINNAIFCIFVRAEPCKWTETTGVSPSATVSKDLEGAGKSIEQPKENPEKI